MTISKVFKLMKAGHIVARTGWDDDKSSWLQLETRGSRDAKLSLPYFYLTKSGRIDEIVSLHPWLPTTEDLLAKDWVQTDGN